MKTKIVSRKKIVAIAEQARKQAKTMVFTNGCFDILHSGHVTYLEKARACGDMLIVGLNRDASIRRLKGKNRPVVPEADRARVLAALACIDHIVLFGEDTPYELIKAIKPDVLVKGSDWQAKDIVGKDILDAYGGKIRRITLVKGRSTTNIIERVLKAYRT